MQPEQADYPVEDQWAEEVWWDYPTAQRFTALSHTTLWRRVNAGEIKAARIGRSVRLSSASLKKFMKSKANIKNKNKEE